MAPRTGPGHGKHVAAHGEATGHRRSVAAGAAAFALLVAGCSSLPDASLPPFHDHRLTAEYVTPADGRIALPSSGDEVRIEELVVLPTPLGEEFAASGRALRFAPGTRVSVRGRVRIYATAGATPRPLGALFPGAVRIGHEDGP
ncbi:MAG: hypothetical protein WAT39_17195 [Planctomycetota bacterium]